MNELQVTDLVVLAHEHDEACGVYRLVAGRQVIQPSSLHEVPVLDDDNQPQYDETEDGQKVLKTTVIEIPEESVGVVDVRDFVWADDDQQWFTKDGKRIPDSDAAEKQRELVAQTLVELHSEAEPNPSRELPGVGEKL